MQAKSQWFQLYFLTFHHLGFLLLFLQMLELQRALAVNGAFDPFQVVEVVLVALLLPLVGQNLVTRWDCSIHCCYLNLYNSNYNFTI